MKIFPTVGNVDDLQLSAYDYWRIIRKRKRLAITFFLIAVCSTAIYSLVHPKIYKATTKILIERGNQNIVSFSNIFPVETGGLDYYPTQYKVLKSRIIGRKVLDELGLRPQFAWTNDPVEALLRQVDVDPVKLSRLVDVSAYSTSPRQAADIANAVVKFYVEQSLYNKLQMTQQASEWLKSKSNMVRGQLTESELELEAVRLQKELVELEERYLPKHPKIIRAQARIKAIEKQLGREVVKDIPLGELPVYYTELSREVESNRKIYETMLSRLKETLASEGIVDTNVVVIDRAEVPMRPVAPRILLNLFLSVLVGAFGGIGLCLVFESLDNTIKSEDDVAKAAQLPLLGMVSKWDAAREELITHEDKNVAISEGFRTIRTSLLFSSPDRPLRTLAITSPYAAEGKTLIACNLAITIAQSGARVVLVDADMRKPRLHQVFKKTQTHGLSHALTNSTDPVEFVTKTHIENLSVLFCGPIPPTPSEMIGSQKMRQLIAGLREHFDYVIFDSPPFMAVTDPVVLATLADGVIIVTRYNKTPREVLTHGKNKFLEVQAKIVGVIINAVDRDEERYQYPAYSYYQHPDKKVASDILSPAEEAQIISKHVSAISPKGSRNLPT